MTRSLLLALVASLGIHLFVACLPYWLLAWNEGITIPQRADTNSSPQKTFNIVLRQASAPASEEKVPYGQTDKTLSAIRERIEINPDRPNDHGEKPDEQVAPKFITPPDFSFVEFYPQELKTQLTFRVYVTRAGLPEHVEPVGTYVLPTELLDQLTKALYRTRFQPATQAGNSVSAYLDIVIDIEPEAEPPLTIE